MKSSLGRLVPISTVLLASLAGTVPGVPHPVARLAAQTTPETRLNRTVDLLHGGESVFGIISSDRSLANARALSRSDLDFVIVDMEHGPWNPETLQVFLLGMTDKQRLVESGSPTMAVTPLVRVPQYGRENMSSIVKQALDVGAFGVMFPFIENREQALAAVTSMRYPQPLGSEIREPKGRRGRSPAIAQWFWGLGSAEYFERADLWPLNRDGSLLAILQIESPEGVEKIDEIVTTPGVGVIFVGPYDLATQMGYGDDPGAPEVEEAIQTILASCLRHGVPCAITTSAANVEERIRQGFRMVTVGGDGGITPASARALDRGLGAAGRR